MKGWKDEWMNEGMNEWKDEWMNGLKDGAVKLSRRNSVSIHSLECIIYPKNEWMNEWMNEWIGRTEKNLKECAAEIKARGGNPVIVQMDHGNDAGLNSKLWFLSI